MKKKVGRPSAFRPEYPVQAAQLCRLGATDKDLADFFHVSEVTINAWKKVHPEFLKSLNDAKLEADAAVERSLFARATGYSHSAVKIMSVGNQVAEVPYTEHYPPDATSMIFWLKNRKPDVWRDKTQHEHDVTDRLEDILTRSRNV